MIKKKKMQLNKFSLNKKSASLSQCFQHCLLVFYVMPFLHVYNRHYYVSNNVKKFLQYNINICVLTLVLWKKIYIKGKGNKNDACLWAVGNSNFFCLVYVPRNLEIKISYITHTHLLRAGIVKVQCHGT